MDSQFNRISQGATNAINQFSSARFVQGTKDFVESNSIVAKFAFLILVLVLFMMALRFGGTMLSWIFSPKQNPYLTNGLGNAKMMKIIPQDPASKNAITIMRSKNEYQGTEFTWSIWVFVDDFAYKENEYKHIFHKGNDNINTTDPEHIGLNYPNNAPGLYITPNVNSLLVIMNTFDKLAEKITIPNLPINKWVNVIIRLSNQYTLDVYINGTLTKRHILSSVPKQNYGDVYMSMNGGFSGFNSELRYFSSALGTNAIQSIVSAGPNLKTSDDNNDLTRSKPQYLSTRWYFADNLDGYNP